MTRGRLAIAAIPAILATTVILQNTRQVETKILFLTLHLPQAVLFAGYPADRFCPGSRTYHGRQSAQEKQDDWKNH